jgi:hypothetical protein
MITTYEDCKFVSLNTQHAILKPSSGTYQKSFLSDIEFSIKDVLKEADDVLYAHINIESAQIPVSFYLINYNTNILKYTVNGSPIILTLNLVRGNYNITSLIKEIKSQFLSAGYVFTIMFDIITGKLTFSSTLDFTFLSASSGSTVNEIIGFDSVASYYSVGNVLQGEHPCSLIGIKKLKFSSTNLRTSSVSSGGGGNLIGVIAVTAPPYGIINYINASPTKGGLLINRNISAIDIQVRDENNNLVNFNNTEWSVTLSVIVTKIYNKVERTSFTRQSQPIAPIAPIVNDPIPLAEPVNDPIPLAEPVNDPIPLAEPVKYNNKTLDLLMYK